MVKIKVMLMRIKFDGGWKMWLILGGISLLFLFLIGTVVSSIFGLFIWILKGLASIVTALLRFSFQSVFSFVGVGLLAYLGYRLYRHLEGPDERRDTETIDYTEEDFER